MPYREMTSDTKMYINWDLMAEEIGDIPGGVAVLRILQAHGLNTLMRREGDDVLGSNDIDHFVHTIHIIKSRKR